MKRFLSALLLVSALAAPAMLAQTGTGDQPAVAFGTGRIIQGVVTAVAPEHVTIKTQAGDTFTIAASANTQVRKDRAPAKLSEIHVGDGVGAMGEVDRPNHTVHALMLFVVDAEQIRKAKENLGKTYIAGKVTAIDSDALKLTILRSDGVTQTITVDEGTSFRRGGRGMQQAMGFGFGGRAGMGQGGEQADNPTRSPRQEQGAGQGESITLADIKVGDLVGGPGALRNGIFIPTELSVGTPGAHGGHRHEGDSAAPNGAHPGAGTTAPQGLR